METSTLTTFLFENMGRVAQDKMLLTYMQDKETFDKKLMEILRALFSETGNPESIEGTVTREFKDLLLKDEYTVFVFKHLTAVSIGETITDDDRDFYYEARTPMKLKINGHTVPADEVYKEEGSFDMVTGEVEMIPTYCFETDEDEYEDLKELIKDSIRKRCRKKHGTKKGKRRQ